MRDNYGKLRKAQVGRLAAHERHRDRNAPRTTDGEGARRTARAPPTAHMGQKQDS